MSLLRLNGSGKAEPFSLFFEEWMIEERPTRIRCRFRDGAVKGGSKGTGLSRD